MSKAEAKKMAGKPMKSPGKKTGGVLKKSTVVTKKAGGGTAPKAAKAKNHKEALYKIKF